MGRTTCGSAPVEQLAGAHASAAWHLGLVAGADRVAATRASLHAVVTAAVEEGGAADPAGILAVARSWAASSPGAGPERVASEPVAAAFWDLPEPLRSALWCTDALHLPPQDVERVAAVAAGAAAVARGRVRRRVCREQRTSAAGTACGPAAEALGKVVAGHAPARKRALVDEHAASCEECAALLAALRDPTATVQAGLPPAPDLVASASRAWRDHVGAPRRGWRPGPPSASSVSPDRTSRRVVAVLAVVTAGSLGAATSQLAAAFEGLEPAATVAAPVRWARPPARPTAPKVVPQAVIPPLASGVALAPGVVPHLTPDLLQVAPVTVPPTPPPSSVPAGPAVIAAAVPVPLGEPPPAIDRSRTVLLGVPLPLPLPLSVEVGPTCSSVKLGPLRLSLPCRR